MKVEQFRGNNKKELQVLLRDLLQRLKAEQVEVESYALNVKTHTKEKEVE